MTPMNKSKFPPLKKGEQGGFLGFLTNFERVFQMPKQILKFPFGPLPLSWGRVRVGVIRNTISLPFIPSHGGRGYF
jgi:hypothetical protein